jgi:hypothetical protein
MNKLNRRDVDELKASSLTDKWIAQCGAESISLEEAIQRGFRAKVLTEELVETCLYLPFYDINGEEVIDSKTEHKIAVIKPRYKEKTKEIEDLPKYICLPKEVQSRQYLHFPKGIEWHSVLNSDSKQLVCLTEGIKKAESGCCNGIPTIALWSIFCFNESGMDSSVIPELKDLLSREALSLTVVYDADRVAKRSVMLGEYSLVDKCYKEAGKLLNILELPQSHQGKSTKGLDDFLFHAGVEEFLELESKQAYTPYIASCSRASSVPKFPKQALPKIYKEYIEAIEEGFENCPELAAKTLLCGGAVILGNEIRIEKKRPNLYAFGVAPPGVGKSVTSYEAAEPFTEINEELEKEYIEKSKTAENINEVKSEAFIVQDFTEEGLNTLLAERLEKPNALYFEPEEFDSFLSKFASRDHMSSMGSYITKAYGAKTLRLACTQESLRKSKMPKPVYEPSLSIDGVCTEQGLLDGMPKKAIEKGMDSRFIRFIGSRNPNKIIEKIKHVPMEIKNNLVKIYKLIRKSKLKADYTCSEDADSLHRQAYRQFKVWELKNFEHPMLPNYKRAITDYAYKLALQFEILVKAELAVNLAPNNSEYQQKCFQESIKDSDYLVSGESMRMALEWSKYFVDTAFYFYARFQAPNAKHNKLAEKTIAILEKHPLGIMKSKLRSELGLHRDQGQKAALDDLLNYLQDHNEIEIKQSETRSDSYTIRLKKHLRNTTITESQS